MKKHFNSLRELDKDLKEYETSVKKLNETPNTPRGYWLEQAMDTARKIDRTVSGVEKRANALLGLALEICGMGDKVGKMRIEIDRKDLRRLHGEFHDGNISFILNVDPHHAIKGNIRRSPLFKIMPLSFPVSWLDATTARVKREMTDLYRA